MRKKGSFRKNAKAEFVQPTVEEINKEIQRKVDYATADILNKINDVEESWLNIKQMESKIKWRLEQLGRDEKGNEIGEVSIQEKFNGGLKPRYMLESEINADFYTYKHMVADIEATIRFLKEKDFTDEDISNMKKGDFDQKDWHEKQGVKKDEKISYTG